MVAVGALTSLVGFAVTKDRVRAATISVVPSGGTVQPIQDAINSASSGDAIEVAAGTYVGNLTINKSITIRCANAGISAGAISGTRTAETNIQGEATVSVPNVTIDGCRFLRPVVGRFLSPKLVRSNGVSGVITVQNSIFDFTWTASDPTLGTSCGAGTYGTAAWRIYDNQFLNTRYVDTGETRCTPELYASRAVQADFAEKIIVSGNHFFNTHQSIYLTGNKADGSEIVNNLFTEAGMGGVYLGEPKDVLIKGNTFAGNSGVYLEGSTGTVIENNRFNVNATLWAETPISSITLRNNAILGKYPNWGSGYEDYSDKTFFNWTQFPIDARSNYWGSATGSGLLVGGTGANLVDTSQWISEFVEPRGSSVTTGFFPINPKVISTLPTGENVQQEFRSVTSEATAAITFSNVTSPGVATVVEYNSVDALPEQPSGFSLGDPPTYFDIDTTAVFSGPVEVCLSYPTGAFPSGTTPKLYHFTEGEWKDVTTSLDESTRTICGSVTSFSPFAVGKVDVPAVAPAPVTAPAATPAAPMSTVGTTKDRLQTSVPVRLRLLTTIRLLNKGTRTRILNSLTPSTCAVSGERLLALREGSCAVQVRAVRQEGTSIPSPGKVVSTFRTTITKTGTQVGLTLTKRGEVKFDRYSSTPKDISDALIKAARSARGVVLVGHTAVFTGNSEGNVKLSLTRANVVRQNLIKQKVPVSRISVLGLAARQPVSEKRVETAQQVNRRVEVYTLS